MIAASGQTNRRRPARGGFSLLETVLSTFLVGMVLVVALHAVGSATSGQLGNAERARACHLASSLLAEILEAEYEEADPPRVFGPEPGESGTGTRAALDDVDDYNGWSESPPKNKDGSVLPNLTGWTRTVTVAYVSPDNLATTGDVDLGVKRVTVTVTHDGRQVASLVTVVTRSWQQPPYD